ncbi:hypothetical protein [Streptomyces sp. RFCAC02]|uniref:hypothetical protein n=1 Tax=Streptomyces sp. RFCAC02 TaxID=2499143 RepID=UPI00101FA994|nr:hypothetical protein [Streptomyces sp. RFCAC02]
MTEKILARNAGTGGPLDECAEGRVARGALPVAATPVIVGAAGAIVIAYAAGRIAGELRPVEN